jgi:ferredoxin
MPRLSVQNDTEKVCFLKITIDRDNCISCGSCEEQCPEVFKLDEDTKSSILPKYRKGDPGKGEVEEHLVSCVESAKDACQVSVISTG